MADDRVNGDSSRQELSMSSALKGGLMAVGLGVAFAHQPWGRTTSRFLGRVVDTYKHTFSKHGALGEVGKEFGDWTERDMNKFLSGVKENWRRSKDAVDDIRLDKSARGSNTYSVANLIEAYRTAKQNVAGIVRKEWAQDRIQNSKFVKTLIEQSGFSENEQRNLRKYSQDILDHARSPEAMHEIARRLQLHTNPALEQASKDIAEFTHKTWTETMAKQRSNTKYTSMGGGDDNEYYTKLKAAATKAIDDNFLSVESLERNAGTIRSAVPDENGNLVRTRRSTMQKFISKLNDENEYTVRDFVKKVQEAKDRDLKEGTGTKYLDRVDTTIKLQGGQSVRVSDEIDRLLNQAAQRGRDMYERMLDVTMDESSLFTDKSGQVYSKRVSGDIWRGFIGFARNTLPGKLFKIGDLDNAFKMSSYQFLGKFTRDPILQARMAKDSQENKFTHIRLGNDIYRVNHETGESELWKQEVKLVSGRYGFYHSIIEAVSGDARTRLSDNAIARKLDIFQDRTHYSGHFLEDIYGRMFGKNERRERYYSLLGRTEEGEAEYNAAMSELHNRTQQVVTSLSEDVEDYVQEQYRTAKNVSKMFRSHTYTLDNRTVRELINKGSSQESKDIYNAMLSNDVDEMLSTVMRQGIGVKNEYLNKDLQNLMTQYLNSPQHTRDTIELVTNDLRLSFDSDVMGLFVSPMTNETYKFEDVLRREMTKEALLREGFDSVEKKVDYTKINDLIDSLEDVDVRQRKEVNKLAQYSLYQRETQVDRNLEKTGGDYYSALDDRLTSVNRLMQTGQGKVFDRFRMTYENLLEDEISAYEGAVEPDIAGSGPFNDVIAMNRSASPLDIVRGLNDALRGRGTAGLEADVMNIFRGLRAGTDDIENYNLYSAIPFWGLKRLSDELNKVGLGFSTESMHSTFDLGMAFMTKRIIPVAVGMTYMDWMDDTSRVTTGTGLWQAMAAGAANVDLAGRKILSGIGADEWMKQTKAVNPIWQYWGDKDEYQGYEERQEYYRNGYDPVRKAAWWTWGGVSEARGGEIQYWQPNFVRRAAANAYDKVMYDGYFDKWSHSWLPTPINPISPLIAWADPYWLERKHAEDRPYATSGPMFEDGTPWGVVLNPTVGLLLKPEKELHDDDYFFFGRMDNGIDIVSLLHNANESIRERARNFTKTHYLSIDRGEATAVNWNAYNAPTPDTQVLSIETRGSIGTIHTGVYGVYGSGGAGYGIGAGGGRGIQQTPGMFGAAPGGGYEQNISQGFNAFDDDNTVGFHILQQGKDQPSANEAFNEAVFGPDHPLARHGDVVQNEKGELGFYHNRQEHKPKGAYLTLKQKVEVDKVIKHAGQEERDTVIGLMNALDPRNMVKDINKKIIEGSREKVDSPYLVSEDEGFTSGKKLASFRPSNAMELLNDADTVSDLINQGQGMELVDSMAKTTRLVGGIYGYMGAEAVGLGVQNDKHIAQSSDMTSFTRGFWDLNIGGLGGSVSEIGRRFIPNYQRMNKVSPLMNTMPDWLPERFRYGDPYTAIPKGEMRLPGKGYEALNELHPDQYGDYGAFDRMKILADIAPNSPEYRMWRDIAKKTVLDPELKEEMEDVKSRARQQGKKHDFYDYNVVGQNLNYERVTVSEILGYGKFRSGERIFKVAGVSLKANEEQTMKDVLGSYIRVGQEITIATDTNEAYAQNKDTQRSINAAVYVDGESVGQQMLESGDAVERKGDVSAAAKIGSLSPLQQSIGYASEIIGHLDIPIISDQWLRIRSPYESYLAENIYGTPYQSWSHPIDTFLMPALERAIHERSVLTNVTSNILWDLLHKERIGGFNFEIMPGKSIGIPEIRLDRDITHKLYMGHLLTDRAALAGTAVSNLLDANNVKMAKPGARFAERAVSIAHMIVGGNSMLDMAAFGAYYGNEFARYKEIDVNNPKRAKYMVIGAAASMAYRAISGKAGEEYVPERVKRNWEMQEYWDRLTYLKYEGLYNEAARRAKEEEGVDVEQAAEEIKRKEEERQGSVKRLKYIKNALGEAYNHKTNYMKNHLLKLVNTRLKELEEDENMVEGGKYTQTALIYKRAAESTMQGLQDNAGWSQIISALPQNDREYFMEFVAERDKDKREKILKTVSPSLQRALRMSWGMDAEKPISNSEYFQSHYLPDYSWEGWNPNVDLKDIEVKTLENEAMNLSDFGFYESQLRNPGAINAQPIQYNRENKDINLSREIHRVLRGKGLRNVEVDVVEKNTMGPTDIVANIGVWSGINHQRHVENALTS